MKKHTRNEKRLPVTAVTTPVVVLTDRDLEKVIGAAWPSTYWPTVR